MSRITAILLAATCVAGAPLAWAQDVAPASSQSAPARPARHTVLQPGDPGCLQSTGSLIPAKPGQCLPVSGRSYSRDDLRRTGAPTTGEALRMLDPSVTVSGH